MNIKDMKKNYLFQLIEELDDDMTDYAFSLLMNCIDSNRKIRKVVDMSEPDFKSKCIEDIISSVEKDSFGCRGLSASSYAEKLVKPLFEKEGISYDGWEISEIPMVDRTGGYQIAVVICLTNNIIKKAFSIYYSIDGEAIFYDVVDQNSNSCCFSEEQGNIVYLDTMQEALTHRFSNY